MRYKKNLSLRAGPVGNLAKFSPMLPMKRPKRLEPPKAGTGMLDGTTQPRKPATKTVGSFLIHWYSEAAWTRTVERAERREERRAGTSLGVEVMAAFVCESERGQRWKGLRRRCHYCSSGTCLLCHQSILVLQFNILTCAWAQEGCHGDLMCLIDLILRIKEWQEWADGWGDPI